MGKQQMGWRQSLEKGRADIMEEVMLELGLNG